jgi:hypothetical protein
VSSVTFVRLACASCVNRLSPPEAIHPIGAEAEAKGTVVTAASLISLFMAAFALSVMTTDEDPPTETRTLLHNTGRTKLCCVGRIRLSAGPGLDQQRWTSAGAFAPHAAGWAVHHKLPPGFYWPRSAAPTTLHEVLQQNRYH